MKDEGNTDNGIRKPFDLNNILKVTAKDFDAVVNLMQPGHKEIKLKTTFPKINKTFRYTKM